MSAIRLSPNALAAALFLGSAMAAHAGGLNVPMDEVRVVRFAHPVATVYVGNPAIADITVIDSTHVFLLGKSYGTTNLVGLDVNRNPVVSDQVQVTAGTSGTVTLNLGANQVTYACTDSRCQPTPTPGDAKDTYDAETDQISKHQDMTIKAAANR